MVVYLFPVCNLSVNFSLSLSSAQREEKEKREGKKRATLKTQALNTSINIFMFSEKIGLEDRQNRLLAEA